MTKLSEKLKLTIDVTSQNDLFKRLGWGTSIPEISKLLSGLERYESAVEKKRKESPSELQAEELGQLRLSARAEVEAWSTAVKEAYKPRIESAKNELRQAIGKRLSKGEGPRRQFLWAQLAAIRDPLRLQQLYFGADDEVKGAIATLPKVFTQTDFGEKLLDPIDPEVVFSHEAESHPEAKRAVDVLETIERNLLSLGAEALSGLSE